GDNYTVHNVTLVNPYQAIKVGPEGNELHTVKNVYGTPLKTGIWIDTCTDIGRLINVDFRPRWWEESKLPGAPASETDRKALHTFLQQEGVAVDMGRSDWEFLYQVRAEGYRIGLTLRPGVQGTTNAVMYGCELLDCATALRLERLNGIGLAATGCKFGGHSSAVHGPTSFDTVAQFNTCEFRGETGPCVLLEGSGTLTFQNCAFTSWKDHAVEGISGHLSLLGCDFQGELAREARGSHVNLGEGILRARLLGNRFKGQPKITNSATRGDVQISQHDFNFARADVRPHPTPPDPKPANRKLFVVTDFGASATEEDNTGAFMKALDAARKAGGGTVSVPAGNYRFGGELVVPRGVELRGCFDVPHHTVSGGSVLMPTAGPGDADGTPFLRLEAKSGLRGLTIWYPGQKMSNVVPYPWAVRSTGPGCWLLDVTLGNAYQGVDFWTHPSDGHVIKYLAGALFKRGLFVSKCKGDGWVEDVQFNPHYSMRLPSSLQAEADEGRDIGGVIDYQRANLEGMVFGRCKNEHVRGTFLYAAYDGIAFRDDGGGANARVIEHGTDTGSRGAVLEAVGAKGVDFLNAQLVPLGKHEVGAIIVGDTFKGKVRFFNSQMWAGNTTGVIGGQGEVLLQQLNTLSGGITIKGGVCSVENASFQRNLEPHVRVEVGCRQARLIGNVTRDDFRLTNEAGARCFARANSLSIRPAPGRYTFRTGWEEGDPQGRSDTVATQGGGQRAVSKPECRAADANPHSGKRCLRVAGNADDPTYSFVYFKVFEGPLEVSPDSLLSYWIRPTNERGTCVGIDLVFADGSILRDSGATTREGQGLHPGNPKGAIGEWTQISIPLGRSHAGKTISAVLFAYDSRAGGGPFEAFIDDLTLESAEAGAPLAIAATPRGGNRPVGTRVELEAPQSTVLRYTLDGTSPSASSPLYDKPILLDRPGLWELRYATQAPTGRVSGRVFGELYEVTQATK
ncbi:MAG: chitobiase/beta-hexosaminidase C-terminal domain-containing protein, partial [Armatimonadetes bacterium]|nr:chitobiase/beta-hexosaminidase C-terminal domain-containing protein [Armatimonadota bacterium]